MREETPFDPIVCPACEEIYDTREKILRIWQNTGYCVNLTCLSDLSAFPIDEALRRRGEKLSVR